MRAVTIILFCAALAGTAARGDDFISEFEYGQMLYQNPRGVSCVPCHGDHGEGALIAAYREEGETKRLRGPNIQRVDRQTLRRVLTTGKGVMPRYFLTDEEIRALYTYIHQENNETERGE
ncbi:cytochrome c [Nitratifractor sp.]|uniref:c-type cytochrome n=1 Tax=Nitratifractor sp. TaxID=2268144 RepID=UPI0025F4C7D4|nr:cytochrome c [Nitratifractor sp.]